MKNFLFTLLTLLPLFGFAQTDSISPIRNDSVTVSEKELISHLDSIVTEIDELIYNSVKLSMAESRNRYKMYQTENMYNLLKLDTQTGKIEQIQWSLDENEEFSIYINSEDLSLFNSVNSFELYPTKNMYQFILLDKFTGRTWHVQWGLSSNKRWIKRIY